MKSLIELITCERRARPLMVAHCQSSLGTGAAYVALLVIAYERFHSAWAITAVLLCELLPTIVLGPLLGAAADRWSRKTLLIGADVLRAGAFLGIALAGTFEATIAFALLAGVGQAAFQPAVMASLGDLVSRERLPAATGLYGAMQEFGYTIGPVLAAASFALAGAQEVLAVNAVTFGVSALLLTRLRLERSRPPGRGEQRGLLASVADGARALRSRPRALTVVLSSAAFVCCLGAVNVAELVLVRDTLAGSSAQYALFVAAMGLGLTAGSLLGATGGNGAAGRRYLAGVLLVAASMAACSLAPTWWVAIGAAMALGVGNGVALVAENVLLQALIPDEIKGRVFGLKGALISTAFVLAYLGSGALVALAGPRLTFLCIAGASLAIWLVATIALRAAEPDPHERAGPATPAATPAFAVS